LSFVLEDSSSLSFLFPFIYFSAWRTGGTAGNGFDNIRTQAMFSFDSVTFLAFVLHSLLLCFPIYAIPLDARQANNLPQTVTTVNTANS
jgi:hypothetical protein